MYSTCTTIVEIRKLRHKAFNKPYLTNENRNANCTYNGFVCNTHVFDFVDEDRYQD